MPWELHKNTYISSLVFWKLIYICVVILNKFLFVVMTAILLSGKSHALCIMHLILITKKCARIFNFTIETTIRLLNLKRRHYGNVDFRNSILIKTLLYKSQFQEHCDCKEILFWYCCFTVGEIGWRLTKCNTHII